MRAGDAEAIVYPADVTDVWTTSLATRKTKAVPVDRVEAVAVIRQQPSGKSPLDPMVEASSEVVRPAVETATPPDPDQPPTVLLSTSGGVIDPRSLLFDPDWYLERYPDVAASGLDPIRHFFDNGAREQRDPNPFFTTSDYLTEYSDVAASRMNPFLHYLLYGAREGRRPKSNHPVEPPASSGTN